MLTDHFTRKKADEGLTRRGKGSRGGISSTVTVSIYRWPDVRSRDGSNGSLGTVQDSAQPLF